MFQWGIGKFIVCTTKILLGTNIVENSYEITINYFFDYNIKKSKGEILFLSKSGKYIIMTNPTNKNLTNNLLPLWTGKELTKLETLELLEEVEGKTEKGKLFLLSNKNTVVLKTKVMNNFRFPITSKDFLNHRINEINNIDKIKVKLL